MNKTNTIHKLSNAVRLYRGSRDGVGDKAKWIRSPQPAKLADIKRHLTSLELRGEEQDAIIAKIHQFKTYLEFNDWIKTL